MKSETCKIYIYIFKQDIRHVPACWNFLMGDMTAIFYFIFTSNECCFIFLEFSVINASLPGAVKNNDMTFFNAYKEALYVFL